MGAYRRWIYGTVSLRMMRRSDIQQQECGELEQERAREQSKEKGNVHLEMEMRRKVALRCVAFLSFRCRPIDEALSLSLSLSLVPLISASGERRRGSRSLSRDTGEEGEGEEGVAFHLPAATAAA